jgi:putative phage-type endonuclease
MADGNALPYEILGSSDDRDRWLQLRRSGVGASEIAAVLGESPWLSAIELYAMKVGASEGAPGLDEAEHVYWGGRLEPSIIAGYQDRTGRPVKREGLLLRSRECPWALCTLDGSTALDVGAPWRPLEIKNIGVQKAREWEEGPPRYYFLQIQQQLLVTGAECATVAALIGGNRMVWCDVPRDEIEIRRIKRAGRIFWSECVEAGVCPKPDGSESATRALAALYRGAPDPESFVHLPGELLMQDIELRELKASISAMKKRADTIENEIKAHIGKAEHGVLPDGTVYSWKQQSRAEYVAKAATFRVLRRHPTKEEKTR